ncbi:hypothetical protein G6O67_008391 [Ophiocordyceps sinensis]|uniref:Uncharacterized protein n=1 Tax=Ophiocordyceps sinensis TaxID=72228 RepID=A0A8H4LR09_9HYPO|nr:hypothetical protein G6O67_008391 [Ophiocordyceps sinensis]
MPSYTILLSRQLQRPANSNAQPTQTPSQLKRPANSNAQPTQTPSQLKRPANSNAQPTQTPSQLKRPANSNAQPTQTPSQLKRPANSNAQPTQTPSQLKRTRCSNGPEAGHEAETKTPHHTARSPEPGQTPPRLEALAHSPRRSVNSKPVLPAEVPHLGQHHARGGGDVDGARQDDEGRVRAAAGLDNVAADGDAEQAGKGDDGVAGGVVAAVVLRLAHAADAHGGDADAGAASEAEEHREGHDTGARVAERQPHAQAGDEGHQDGEEARVEGPDHVGVVAGQGPAEDGAGVHDGQQVEGKRLAEALVQGIGGDVGQGDEEGELDEEDGNGGEGKGHLAKDAKVGPGRGVRGGRQTRAYEQDAQQAADEADEGEDARGLGVADAVEERRQHEGEDDAADATGRRRHARREAAPEPEPVADGGDARREEERGAEAGEHAKREDELPQLWRRLVATTTPARGPAITFAEAHGQDAGHGARAPGDDEPPRAILVEDGPDVDAAEEGEKGVYGEDPADGALAVVAELVAERVGLEDADRVHQAHGRDHGEPAAQDDEPRLQPALGVRLLVRRRRDARRLLLQRRVVVVGGFRSVAAAPRRIVLWRPIAERTRVGVHSDPLPWQ